MPKTNLGRDPNVKSRRDVLYGRYGGYMTVSSVMKELGVTRPTAMKFLSDLPSYAPTGRKLYDISDIAAKIEGSRIPAAR